MNELSKYLCFLLRHKPEQAHLDMDKHGWVSVEQLIANVNRYSKYHLDICDLEKIVAEDVKGRYVFNETYEMIKCCQGHSIPWVEPELEYLKPPDILYHGTTVEALEGILAVGAIKKMQRHAVHLTSDIDKAWEAAERWGKTPVVIRISAIAMHYDGYRFAVPNRNRPWDKPRISGYVTLNGHDLDECEVWLTEEVPANYIRDPVYKKENDEVIDMYVEMNDKEIKHIPDVVYGQPDLCIVDDFRDYNRDSLDKGYDDYIELTDNDLLAFDDDYIHSIMNKDTLVRIARLAPERLTKNQYEAAKYKLKNSVVIDQTDVEYIIDVIRSSEWAYCLPSKHNSIFRSGASTEEIVAALHNLTVDDYVYACGYNLPGYIGDRRISFAPKRPLVIGDKLTIDEPFIDIRIDTDKCDYDTMILINIGSIK